jgi:hypothetical protein
MRHVARFLLAPGVALVLGLAAAPPFVRAHNPGPAAASPSIAEVQPADREAYWRSRTAEAQRRVSAAQAALDGANADVSRMRRRNHPRGEPRAALFAARDEARNDLEKAVRHLEVELPQEAQASGASLHWLGN